MENKHKYTIQVPFIESLDTKSKTSVSVNYSKTLGCNNNWIGCGYIDREEKTKTHKNVMFPYFSLVFVAEGKGTFTDDHGQEYALAKGTVFLRKPGYQHSSHCESKPAWKEYYLDCDQLLYQHLSLFLLPDSNGFVFQTSQPRDVIDKFSAFIEFISKAREADMPDVYVSFIKLLNYIFNKKHNQHVYCESETIRQVKADLDSLYKQRFDLKDYCESQSLNYDAFRKEFKEQTGLSLMHYIIRHRLDKACTLLRTTNLRISEISDELGYSSQYEFSNQFKRHFNLSPKQYRTGVG